MSCALDQAAGRGRGWISRIMGIRRARTDVAGVTEIEYGLLTALIALAVIGSLSLVGTNMKLTYCQISSAIESALGLSGGSCGLTYGKPYGGSADPSLYQFKYYSGSCGGSSTCVYKDSAGDSANLYGWDNSSFYIGESHGTISFTGSGVVPGPGSNGLTVSSAVTLPLGSKINLFSEGYTPNFSAGGGYTVTVPPGADPSAIIPQIKANCSAWGGTYYQSSTTPGCVMSSSTRIYNVIDQFDGL